MTAVATILKGDATHSKGNSNCCLFLRIYIQACLDNIDTLCVEKSSLIYKWDITIFFQTVSQYTVNDLFSTSALVTAPYLFSKQYT